MAVIVTSTPTAGEVSMLTLVKSIEILALDLTYTYPARYDDLHDAIKMGSAAISRILTMRSCGIEQALIPLPGENPDDSAQSTFEHEAPKTIYHRSWAVKPTLLPGEDSQ